MKAQLKRKDDLFRTNTNYVVLYPITYFHIHC